MTDFKFRDLKASEIECRVQSVKETGFSLLLYKDARCDMGILDETVGLYNWQRSHSRDNRNCTVSLWDEKKQMWVSKEDVGTESNTEATKGLASDSFKRACFNVGIGRELYTAPFVWISDASYIKKIRGRDGKDKFTAYEKFVVSSVTIVDKVITGLIVTDSKGRTVFDLSKKIKPIKAAPVPPPKTIQQQQINLFDVLTNALDTAQNIGMLENIWVDGRFQDDLMSLPEEAQATVKATLNNKNKQFKGGE